MEHKFTELMSSPLMNLDHTYRYSGTKLVESESLSQHIVDTIMMGIMIIDDVNHILGYELLDPSKYVMKAVYHDLEEAITGDIPRPLKYYNEATRTSLKDVADKVAKDLFKSQFNDSQSHYEIWEKAKDSFEGYILKIVDTLVVATKVIKEVKMLNNLYMLRVAHEVRQYLEELHEKSYIGINAVDNYLHRIIIEAIMAMNELLEEHNYEEHASQYGQSLI